MRRRLRIVRRVGVVLRQGEKNARVEQGAQIPFESIRKGLVVDFFAFDIDGEGGGVLGLLLRIVDRRLRPSVERIVLDSVLFGFGHIIRKGVELADGGRAVSREHIRHRLVTAVAVTRARTLGEFRCELEAELIFPLFTMTNSWLERED